MDFGMNARYELELNIFSRRSAINAVRFFCDLYELEYEIREYRGWLSSQFLIRARGSRRAILLLHGLIASLAKRLNLRRVYS